MKKYFLTKLNFLLGAASLGLIGCGTTKNSVQNNVTSDPITIEPVKAEPKPQPVPLPEEPMPAPNPDEPTPVKYGVPYAEY